MANKANATTPRITPKNAPVDPPITESESRPQIPVLLFVGQQNTEWQHNMNSKQCTSVFYISIQDFTHEKVENQMLCHRH